MDVGTKAHLSTLKEALHTLKDTGSDGFEGLLAAVLTEVCGQPFRLASSGSQRGRDGDSAFDAGATYFEAKLYRGEVQREAVSPKLNDLIVDDKGQVDTWALCATAPIRSQHAQQYRDLLSRVGIGCLILDWPDHILPTLAVLLASAPATTAQFLNDHSSEKSKVTGIRAAIDAIVADSQFAEMSGRIRTMLRDPVLGLGLAKAANKKWLSEAFSDRRQARQYFGQPLAPLDPSGLAWIDRPDLMAKLAPAFVGTPDQTVFIVIGEEGAGKSWLVAKSWLNSAPTPLLGMFTADELRIPEAMNELEATIIAKLVSQTEGSLTEAVKARWERRLKGWRANPNPANVRLAVVVDGLNQAQDFPWPRWIDATAKFLKDIGGRLIVTTNERHFAQRIRGTVTSQTRRVVVPEWTEDELRRILAANGVSSDVLSADVFRFLRNPRILGIAVELLNAKDIERFEELTLGRLLFEHIRRCERDATSPVRAQEFAKALQKHAEEIVDRFSRQQRDDLKVFQAPLDGRLKAVSNSRFFADVAGEPDLYEIRDDGLPLALGLSLLSSLRTEERNGRDPYPRLLEIAEPIQALAETSEVILSALQVACLDSDCPVSVQAAFARYYLSLQNVPETQWPAFEALAKASPRAFVKTARDAALSGEHVANIMWLTAGLLGAQVIGASQPANEEVSSWLSYYSLAPERAMFAHPRHSPREEVEAERAKRQAELDAKLSALSQTERNFIETRLHREDDGNLSGLHLTAFQLLARTKLAGFSNTFVNWAFANALNSGIDAPYREFAELIRLNSADWHETREALIRAAEPLMRPGISRTGRWALVAVLRATGHPDDAARAEEIAEELTKDRPRFPGWRLVETYCANDPCDPSSHRPDNINKTAEAYKAADVTRLRQGPWMSAEDHFFSDARTGLARFEPQAAIGSLQRFARNVLERNGLPLRQGIFALPPDSAVLDTDIVDGLIELARRASSDRSDSDDMREEWVTGQYALLAAMPHKTGDEQLAILESLSGRSLLIPMLEAVSAASEATVEECLERVVQADNRDAQVRVLSFIQYSRSPLSARSRRRILELVNSNDRLVRGFALAISAHLRDPKLLKQIIDSGWDAHKLNAKEDYYERWYGSAALIEAAEIGLIDPAETVRRIAGGFFGYAASRLPGAGTRASAACIDLAISKAAKLERIAEFPLLEQPVPSEPELTPPLLSLADTHEHSDPKELFDRINETDQAFLARQKRAWQAFDQFRKEIIVAEAGIVLDDVSWIGLEAIVSSEPQLGVSWLSLLANVSDRQLQALHFFALGLARAMAKVDPAASATLFHRLSEVEPLIRRVFGPAEISAEGIALWSIADLPQIKALCFQRLDRASNDRDLAAEVLAASREGKGEMIKEYVDGKLEIGNPSAIARALTVVGFSDSNPHADEVLNRFGGQKGFVGRAAAAARYAYERNKWSRYWFEQMKSAQEPQEFWRYAVLLTKTVDGRNSLWGGEHATPSPIFERFFPTIGDRVKKRLKHWTNERKKTLFGEKVPDRVFLRID